MYVIVNLATRCILTTKQDDMMMFVNPELAEHSALHAQDMTNEPHVVYPLDDVPQINPWMSWHRGHRERAPWLM